MILCLVYCVGGLTDLGLYFELSFDQLSHFNFDYCPLTVGFKNNIYKNNIKKGVSSAKLQGGRRHHTMCFPKKCLEILLIYQYHFLCVTESHLRAYMILHPQCIDFHLHSVSVTHVPACVVQLGKVTHKESYVNSNFTN